MKILIIATLFVVIIAIVSCSKPDYCSGNGNNLTNNQATVCLN